MSAYVQYASSRTDAPLNYHRYAAISVCAAALTNKVYIDADWARVYPALWICFVGPSNHHKTTAVSLATGLLNRARADIELPQTFSAEAIIEHLSRRPYGIMRWGELGVGMEFLVKDYNTGVVSSLCDLWDAKPVTRLTKGAGSVRVDNAALSILAGGKRQWFLEYAKSGRNIGMAVGTGFFGRWLFVMGQEKNGWHGMFERHEYSSADRIVEESLVEHLAALLDCEGEVAPGPGSLLIDAWLQKIDREWSDDTDPAEFSRRAGAQVAKLALGIQACRGVAALTELGERPVEQAIALWEYSFESGRELVRMIMGHSDDAAELDRYDKALAQLGGQARQRDLLRRLTVTTPKFLLFAHTLEEQGRWGKEVEQSSHGARPTVTWRRI